MLAKPKSSTNDKLSLEFLGVNAFIFRVWGFFVIDLNQS